MKQKLSEDFIREIQDKVDWECISRQQKLSEEFIREFQNKVDWYYIRKYQKLSEDFIIEFCSPYQIFPSDDSSELQCCICLIEQSSTFVKTKCNHIFHKECIDEWLKTNTTCPMCRRVLNIFPSRYIEVL
jgi:hypothetical protein